MEGKIIEIIQMQNQLMVEFGLILKVLIFFGIAASVVFFVVATRFFQSMQRLSKNAGVQRKNLGQRSDQMIEMMRSMEQKLTYLYDQKMKGY